MNKTDSTDQTRAQLIEKAMELFARQGYHKTSTASISHAAGVSIGLLFYHFKNKEGLLEAIIDHVLEQLNGIIHFEETTATARERMELVINRFAGSLKRDKALWELYTSIIFQPDTRQVVWTKVHKAARQFRRVIYSLLEEMRHPDPGKASFEFEIFRVGIFAAYLANQRDDLLYKSIAALKNRFLSSTPGA
jgi:AcrR family transcriptional regulator